MKHQIHGQYIATWGGIIVNGAALHAEQAKLRGMPFEVHLVYVDANASSGRYEGEQADAIAGHISEPIFGSPIIGIRALDKLAPWAAARGVNVRTNSVLIEIAAKEFSDLQDSLSIAGLAGRARITSNLASLRNGEIALLHTDCVSAMSEVIAYTHVFARIRVGHSMP